jgi:ligand-binding SRPBCC domain-containing protein
MRDDSGMARSFEISVTSRVTAPAERVWERITTPEGINHEMRPVFRMTVPKGLAQITPEQVPLGRKWFRSWILLGGVLPVDYDDLTVIRIEPGRGFLERSPMLSQREWEHERTIEPAGDECTVTDRVRFTPRAGFLGPLMRPLFQRFFRRRHRRLVGWFAR